MTTAIQEVEPTTWQTCTCCGYVYPAADMTDRLCETCAEDVYCADEQRREWEERQG